MTRQKHKQQMVTRWDYSPEDPHCVEDGMERTLQAQAERYLSRMQARGKILAYYHRPDRKPGRGERRGLPDLLIAIAPGRVIAVELKTSTGRLSEAQAEWLVGFGGRGYVCRSIQALAALVDGWVKAIDRRRLILDAMDDT